MRRRHLGTYAVLTVLAAFALGPLVVLVSTSLKSQSEQGTNPLGPPLHPDFGNFSAAWTQGNLATTMRNSALISIGTSSACASWRAWRPTRWPGST